MSNSSAQACAACKYQRRKCSPYCPLAPFFPASQPKQFLNVHRLFGVSNVLRILRQVNPSMKAETVKSIVYEADAWERDPVYGCWGLVSLLQNQVDRLQAALEHARSQIFLFEQCPDQISSLHNSWNGFNPDASSTNFVNAHRCPIDAGQQADDIGLASASPLPDYPAFVAGTRDDGSTVLQMNVELHSFHGISEPKHQESGDPQCQE